MIKSLFFGMWLVLAAILLPSNLSAQEIIEPIDSMLTDTMAADYDDVDEIIEIVDSTYIDEDELIIDSVLTDTGEMVADTFKLSDSERWKRSIPQYDLKEYEWVDVSSGVS